MHYHVTTRFHTYTTSRLYSALEMKGTDYTYHMSQRNYKLYADFLFQTLLALPQRYIGAIIGTVAIVDTMCRTVQKGKRDFGELASGKRECSHSHLLLHLPPEAMSS
jgi:hypothetical protein